MQHTAKTPFRTFKRGLIRKPPLSMNNGITTQNQSVDINLANTQHEAYARVLRHLKVELDVVATDERHPDCHFVEDTAIVHNNVAIMTRPGALARREEGKALISALAKTLEIMHLESALDDDKATVDGGDVLFMGNRVFIGISDRTTLAGAKALTNLLTDIDNSLHCHFIEFANVLHLKSGLTALNEELLLGNPLMKLRTPFPFGEIAYLPLDEGYAANALVINGAALYFEECKRAGEIIAKANLQAIPAPLSEFKKMDGSFTCLSLLW